MEKGTRKGAVLYYWREFKKNVLIDFFKDLFYLFTFRERRRQGEREGEKRQYVRDLVASHTPPTGHLCPDWESNQRPFGSQASTQSTEQQQPEYLLICWTERERH